MAAIVPLLLFTSSVFRFAAREQRQALDARAPNVPDKLILTTDAEVVRYALPLDVLATSCIARELIAAAKSAAAA